jgi:hypothetical protein
MQVTIDSEPMDVQMDLRRNDPRPDDENLYMNGTRVVRVTHALIDEIPVILVLENDTIVEVERQTFYTIPGMHEDWQPGTQSSSMGDI